MTETRLPQALGILREGWIRGDYSSREGHCLLGATYKAWGVLYACDGDTWTPENARAAERDELALDAVIREQYGVEGIATFNDNPTTTFPDVERVVEKAIAKREEEI